jgi:hypothetical protein
MKKEKVCLNIFPKLGLKPECLITILGLFICLALAPPFIYHATLYFSIKYGINLVNIVR